LAMLLARRVRPSLATLAPLVPLGAAAAPWPRLVEIGWFFLKVGLVSFGGAYAVLPFLREGAVTTHHWLTDHQMIDALALGETTPGPLISIGIFVGYLAGAQAGAPLAGATAAAIFLFLPSFVFVLALAPFMDRVTALPGAKDFLSGVTAGVVGLMLSLSIPLAQVALVRNDRLDLPTLLLGVAAFAVVTFWKSRWNVVAVVLGGGAIGLGRVLL
ncbi:MAG TPA: chromate transporter, partial [bacterium]|nr:chromate transporter [bacterium]